MSADDRRQPTAAQARAEVEARRDRDRDERLARFREVYGDTVPGRAVWWVSWCSTGVLAAATAAAVVDPDSFAGIHLGVALVEFLLGSAAFVVVLVLAAARSREDTMGIGGLFFLVGCAPAVAQRALLGSLAAQVVVAVVGAALRPFTPLAFGTLAPMLALSLCGWWAVRHGVFPPRADLPGAAGRGAPETVRGGPTGAGRTGGGGRG